MRAAAAVAALLLLSSVAVTAAARPDAASAQAQSAQQQPAPHGPVPRPPPPPYAQRPRPPPSGSGKPRPPPPGTDPYVLVPVRLSGYANVAQAARFAGLMSSLVRVGCAVKKVMGLAEDFCPPEIARTPGLGHAGSRECVLAVHMQFRRSACSSLVSLLATWHPPCPSTTWTIWPPLPTLASAERNSATSGLYQEEGLQ